MESRRRAELLATLSPEGRATYEVLRAQLARDMDRCFAESKARLEKGVEAVFGDLRPNCSRVPSRDDAERAKEIVAATATAPALSTPAVSHVFPAPVASAPPAMRGDADLTTATPIPADVAASAVTVLVSSAATPFVGEGVVHIKASTGAISAPPSSALGEMDPVVVTPVTCSTMGADHKSDGEEPVAESLTLGDVPTAPTVLDFATPTPTTCSVLVRDLGAGNIRVTEVTIQPLKLFSDRGLCAYVQWPPPLDMCVNLPMDFLEHDHQLQCQEQLGYACTSVEHSVDKVMEIVDSLTITCELHHSPLVVENVLVAPYSSWCMRCVKLDIEDTQECLSFLQPKPPWSHLASTISTSELMSDMCTVLESLYIIGTSFELDLLGFPAWCLVLTDANCKRCYQSFECIQTEPCSAIQGKSENLLTGTSFSEENQLQVLAALGTFGCELFSIMKIWNYLQYEYLQQWRPPDRLPICNLALVEHCYSSSELSCRFESWTSWQLHFLIPGSRTAPSIYALLICLKARVEMERRLELSLQTVLLSSACCSIVLHYMGTGFSLQSCECPWFLGSGIQPGYYVDVMIYFTAMLIQLSRDIIRQHKRYFSQLQDLLTVFIKLQPWPVWDAYFSGHMLQPYTRFGSITCALQKCRTDDYTGRLTVAQVVQVGNTCEVLMSNHFLIGGAAVYDSDIFQWEIAWAQDLECFGRSFQFRQSCSSAIVSDSSDIIYGGLNHYLPYSSLCQRGLTVSPGDELWCCCASTEQSLDIDRLRKCVSLDQWWVSNCDRKLHDVFILSAHFLSKALQLSWDPGDLSSSAWRQCHHECVDDARSNPGIFTSQVPWDPGGAMLIRLGGKPNFMEGGLSASLCHTTGLARLMGRLMGLGRSGQPNWKQREAILQIQRQGQRTDGLGTDGPDGGFGRGLARLVCCVCLVLFLLRSSSSPT